MHFGGERPQPLSLRRHVSFSACLSA